MNPAPILPPPGVSQIVPLAAIPTGESAQARVRIRPAVVRDYAQAMTQQVHDGALRFPAIVLFSDGRRYILADGFHRVLAARKAGLVEFPAEVRPGNERDALFYSISANAEHGLPRSNADKRKAVSLLLADAEWSMWSDHEIARHCGVSQWLVSKLRKGASESGFQMRPRKVKRGDTVYEMQPGTSGGQETTSKQSTQPALTPLPACDRLGLPLPADAIVTFALAADFSAAQALLAELATLVDRLAQGAAGAALRQHLSSRAGDGRVTFYSPGVNFLVQQLVSATPHCGRCPRCVAGHAGRIQPTCKLCGGRGWLSKAEFETCTLQERQVLERLRTG